MSQLVEIDTLTTNEIAPISEANGPAAALLFGVLLLVAACSSAATQSSGPSVGSVDAIRTAPTPGPTPTPDGVEVRVHGWPTTSRNAAGVYSWDGSTCAYAYCSVGFMHNGYGSGDVEIFIDVVPGGLIIDDSGAAVTVAGHDGIYRRIDAQLEEWIVDIEGTRISIQLKARPGTSATELAEAHAIIASMRTEPRNNALGFRLVFTLTTNDWDSG